MEKAHTHEMHWYLVSGVLIAKGLLRLQSLVRKEIQDPLAYLRVEIQQSEFIEKFMIVKCWTEVYEE